MKKLALFALLAGVLAPIMAQEKATKIVSVNRAELFQKSKPGLSFIELARKREEQERTKLEAKAKELQKEGARLEQQIAMLSEDEIMKRKQSLGSKARALQGEEKVALEDLKAELEGAQIQVFMALQKASQKVFETKGADMMVDPSSNPGIIAVSSAIDVTGEVLALVNAEHDKLQKDSAKKA
jgi:Skp family chaperone for outer membrane proteins